MFRAAFFAAVVVLATAQRPVTVNVQGGSITGYAHDAPHYGSVKYLGIPYAEPPVGEKRWESPVLKTDVGQVDAKELTVGCPQECVLPPMICPPKISEDCLFLNVFTPMDAKKGDGLPILFFIHGGNFFQGYGGGVLYDGSYYANNSRVVVVSINYRLGTLGFLTGPTMKGNYGIEDQQTALKWVWRNIENFGGDPTKITLWGQSAGAMSIAIHLSNEVSDPLFKQAILMSEPFTLPFRPTESADIQGYALAKALDCHFLDVACLKSRNVSDVLAAEAKVATELWTDLNSVLHAFTAWAPTINGTGKIVDPTNAMYWGNAQDKPIIIGNVGNEGRVFIWQATRNATTGQDQPMSREQLDALELTVFRDKFLEVHERYPPNSTDNKERATTLATEYIFNCANRKLITNAINLTPGGRKSPIYYYLIDRPMSFAKYVWTSDPECWDFTCHGGDLAFAFAQMYNPGLVPYNATFEPGEIEMSKQYGDFFGSFAHFEQPRSQDMLWEAYDPVKKNMVHFMCNSTDTQTRFEEDTIGPRYDCDWWDTAVNKYNINGAN
ncbi:cAMP-regulated D2 protein [Diplonema papillatum]|nr:cAMP-regulated D2 protein [Diplonema papillatum]